MERWLFMFWVLAVEQLRAEVGGDVDVGEEAGGIVEGDL